jgi:hypothetical protein
MTGWLGPGAGWQEAALLACALLLTLLGLFALLRRGHWLTTLLFSSAFLSLAAFHAGALGVAQTATSTDAAVWASYLARVSALVSWLWLTLSVVLGRTEPRQSLRSAGAYLALSLLACLVLTATAGTPYVVHRVEGAGPGTLVVFGALGKLYLMYLVVAMVAVLMNLESTLRNTSQAGQRHLRPLVVAILVSILSELLVVSSTLLYGGLRVEWLATSAPVVFLSGAVAALALARRRLSDMSVPVARPVVYYSSVSLTLAGVFLLGTAVLSRLVPAMSPEWRAGITIAFVVAVGGGGLLLLLHPASGRAIRRFVDRNLYANRYDYRREWERVTTELVPSARPEELARRVESLVTTVFDAERIALYLRDDAGAMRRLQGGARLPGVVPPTHPLLSHFRRQAVPVVFTDLGQDLDLLPLVVESRPWIDGLDAAVCAPLLVGEDLVGLLWLSRRRQDENWSWEDIEFLGAFARQVAAALAFARQAEQAAEARQLESLHRLSSYVLHDIKNQVSGLSLVVENARRHLGNPEFQRDAMGVVERAVDSLRELMDQVAGVGRQPPLQRASCEVGALVDEALQTAGLALGSRPGLEVVREVSPGPEVVLDRRRIARVLVNLLINAREAAGDQGRITVRAGFEGAAPDASLVLEVRDEGRGMSEEFLRTRLFRPFQTTKSGGLGIGLAQCRGIVEAHGGGIEATSEPGRGTCFRVRLPLAGPVAEPGHHDAIPTPGA